jgi:RNA polymerase sigma-70 factor (ECF subfamily)
MSEIGDQWPSTRVSLLHQLRAVGDCRSWETFVSIYSPLLFRLCRRRRLQDADARDVTQNVLLAVQNAIGSFEYDLTKGKFRSWLGTIAAHEIVKYQKRALHAGRGTGGSVALPDTDPENDAVWIAEFNSHVFQTAMARIQPEFDGETWQAFDQVWMHDQPPRSVAQQLNRNPDWVYRAKYRVLHRLKAEVRFLTADIASFTKE